MQLAKQTKQFNMKCNIHSFNSYLVYESGTGGRVKAVPTVDLLGEIHYKRILSCYKQA